MKTFVAVLLAMGISNVAVADGFVCDAEDGNLRVKVLNHVKPEEGTRNAAVMILSDTAISVGRKTIARFTDVKETLANSGAHYVADVDLRFADSRRKGELIGGTKLGQLDSILLDVAFTYAAPMEAGETTPAVLTLIKRSGDQIMLQMECTRYLKH